MRVHQLLLTATLALAAVHCSSSDPAPKDAMVTVSQPSALVITSPARASFLESDTLAGKPVEVTGTGATSALTVNGAPVTVAADGSFTTTIVPVKGLNLIVALDGDSRLESPFLFGHFQPATTPVANAIALDVGAAGMSALAPAASIQSVTNLALANRNLMTSFVGQTFTGDVTAATWTFTVTGGSNGAASVELDPIAFGLGAKAQVADLLVDGRLSLTTLGITYARDVRITASSATVGGNLKLDVDPATGVLGAAMPVADTTLNDFRFDTDNVGFPCCVDTILTGFIKPKLQDAVKTALTTEVPKLVALTLQGIGIPRLIDYTIAGVPLKIPVATQFDSSRFDAGGGTLTASTLFGGAFTPGSPGAKAPGWIQLGGAYVAAPTRAPVLGVSFSIDAVNQLMFAAWGSGQLAYTTGAPLNAKLTTALPPVVTMSDDGTVHVGVGELLLTRTGSAKPMAAVTLMAQVEPMGDGDALVLTPKGEPTISVTILSDELVGSGTNLIAAAAKDQLTTFLKPFRIPVPSFALDALGSAFAGQSLALVSPKIVVDPVTGRLSASGALQIGK